MLQAARRSGEPVGQRPFHAGGRAARGERGRAAGEPGERGAVQAAPPVAQGLLAAGDLRHRAQAPQVGGGPGQAFRALADKRRQEQEDSLPLGRQALHLAGEATPDLAVEPAPAVMQVGEQIGLLRHDPGAGLGRGPALRVAHHVGHSAIRGVTERRYDRQPGFEDGARHELRVEGVHLLEAPAASSEDDHVGETLLVAAAKRAGDAHRRARPLDLHRVDGDAHVRVALPDGLLQVVDHRTGRRRQQGDGLWQERKATLALGRECAF